jgi:hypothetical protein
MLDRFMTSRTMSLLRPATRLPSRMLFSAVVSVVRYKRGAGSAHAGAHARANTTAKVVLFIVSRSRCRRRCCL